MAPRNGPNAVGTALMHAAGALSRSSGLQPGVSPLVASFNDPGIGLGAMNPNILPRPPSTFTTGAFGPQVPIWPMAIDQVDEGTDSILPRRTVYPVAWNLPIGLPGTEGIGKLAPFSTLRTMADSYSVARQCVFLCIREIIGLEWDIVPTKAAAAAMEGSATARADFEKRKSDMMDFWTRFDRSPDSPYDNWEDALHVILEDLIVCSASGLFIHPPWMKHKGWFDSDVASLDIIDGATLRPMYSIHGGLPAPSAPAFQQYVWGVPRVDFETWVEGLDLEELPDFDDSFGAYQMRYLKWNPRSWAPYGMSLVESVLLPISIGLARQNMQLQFWTEGSVPYLYVVPGSELIASPTQVAQLQTALNNLAGDTGWKQKIIVLPPGSKTEPVHPNPLADQFDEWILSLVTMGFGKTPMDLGVTPRVAAVQSPAASKQMADVASQNKQDTWLMPTCNWLKSHLFDYVIQRLFKQLDMEWQWKGLEDSEDEDALATRAVNLVKGSLLSVDEGRKIIGYDPIGEPHTSEPLVFTATGAVPLGDSSAQGTAQAQAATDRANDPQSHKPPVPALNAGPPQQSKPPKPNSLKPQDQTVASAGQAAAEATKPAPPAKAQLAELDVLCRLLKKGRAIDRFESRLLSDAVIREVRLSLPDVERAKRAGEAELCREHRLYIADLTLAVAEQRADPQSLAYAVGRLEDSGLLQKRHDRDDRFPQPSDVEEYLQKTYPDSDLDWVETMEWTADSVPLDEIDGTPPSGGLDQKTIKRMVKEIEDGQSLHPLVLVKSKVGIFLVVDGHHRLAAYIEVDAKELPAWVGDPGKDDGWKKDVVAMQRHRLNDGSGYSDKDDPERKSFLPELVPGTMAETVRKLVTADLTPDLERLVASARSVDTARADKAQSDMAESIGRLAEAVSRTPAPVVNVQPTPLRIEAPKAPEVKVEVPAPVVTVNVPEQPAPIVNVAAPEVKMPTRRVRKTTTATRNEDGSITVETEES